MRGYNEVIANYKNPTYYELNGYNHYGIDIRGYTGSVYSLGYGYILKSEYSDNYGGVMVIRYNNVITPEGCIDLIARYLHLSPESMVFDEKDPRIEPYTYIGNFGNYGTTDPHLHIELDTDTSYPYHSPQVAGDNVLQAGIDTTLNPMDILVSTEDRYIDYKNLYNPKLTSPLQECKTLGEITAPSNSALYDFIDELHRKTTHILGKNK